MKDKKEPSFSIRPGTSNTSEAKRKAMEIVSQVDDPLNTKDVHYARVDLAKSLWAELGKLKVSASTDENKSVTYRMLVTEALGDLFDKYERGEGKYFTNK